MNRENLQRMADYIRTVPQSEFTMSTFRVNPNDIGHQCNTVGCVVGHCTILDKNPLPIYSDTGEINFYLWSEQFTGLEELFMWDWCFSSRWCVVDNTTNGAALRIKWLLKNGLPENWFDQMEGEAPLCYYEGGKP
jgi:hypothetical protein